MAAQDGHTDSLQVLVLKAKAEFDKATTNDGAMHALAMLVKGSRTRCRSWCIFVSKSNRKCTS